MKRFFCFLFLLALLPVVSLASFDDTDVIGCWVSLDSQYSESNNVRMIVFYDNHIAYCTLQSFFFNSLLKKKPVTQSFSTWEFDGSCILMTDRDSGKETKMYLLDQNCISYYPRKVGVLYHKANEQESSDLSQMSYDELVQLRDQINLAIWNSQEWQSVEVPSGVYVIGVDIPAGHWTLKPPAGDCVCIEYFKDIDETGKRPADSLSNYYSESLADESYAYASLINMRQVDIDMKEGFYLTVINGSSVIFEPYISKPAFSFK